LVRLVNLKKSQKLAYPKTDNPVDPILIYTKSPFRRQGKSADKMSDNPMSQQVKKGAKLKVNLPFSSKKRHSKTDVRTDIDNRVSSCELRKIFWILLDFLTNRSYNT